MQLELHDIACRISAWILGGENSQRQRLEGMSRGLITAQSHTLRSEDLSGRRDGTVALQKCPMTGREQREEGPGRREGTWDWSQGLKRMSMASSREEALLPLAAQGVVLAPTGSGGTPAAYHALS